MLAFVAIAPSSTSSATIYAHAKHGKSVSLNLTIDYDRVQPPSVIEQPVAHLKGV